MTNATRTWADCEAELIRSGRSPQFAKAMISIQQSFQRLGADPSAPRIKTYLSNCKVLAINYLTDPQIQKLADELSRIQSPGELGCIEDLSDLLSQIDIELSRLKLTESSLLYRIFVLQCGAASRAQLDGNGLRKMLRVLKSCNQLF